MKSFSEKVYQLTKQIPKGKVSTYKAVAQALGTQAYQAVGQALKNNLNAPVIPCHRVVSSKGTIGGFCGQTSGKAIKKKKTLLKQEGIRFKNNKIVNFHQVMFELK